MPFDREWMKVKAAGRAARDLCIGTSSWKCDGWFGQIYTPARYDYRGEVAKTCFERDCLPTSWGSMVSGSCRYGNYCQRHKMHLLADVHIGMNCPCCATGGVVAWLRRSSKYQLRTDRISRLEGLAGALGVAKGFLRVSCLSSRFVTEPQGISLWRPDLDWRSAEADGPKLEVLPVNLWLLWLGYLGQAYLWNLGLLPYSRAKRAAKFLQDFDRVVVAN